MPPPFHCHPVPLPAIVAASHRIATATAIAIAIAVPLPYTSKEGISRYIPYLVPATNTIAYSIYSVKIEHLHVYVVSLQEKARIND